MSTLNRIRRRTWQVLEVGSAEDHLSRTIDLMIMALVLGNVVCTILESVPAINSNYQDLFLGFERISIAAFSAEFALRLWSSASASDASVVGMSDTRKRLAYLTSPLAIVDLIAIVPAYLSAIMSVDLRFMRIFRLLRLVKLTRYSAALNHLFEVIRMQRAALTASLFLMSVAIVFSAGLVYAAEHKAQPEDFGSIPAAMWWAVCTLTTVGYGDVTPVTNKGKMLASVIQLLGIAMVALPTSLFASGFANIMARNERRLENEARTAWEDGVLDRSEAEAIAMLADQLYVEPEVAQEIVAAAQKRQNLVDGPGCPHCGKPVN